MYHYTYIKKHIIKYYEIKKISNYFHQNKVSSYRRVFNNIFLMYFEYLDLCAT